MSIEDDEDDEAFLRSLITTGGRPSSPAPGTSLVERLSLVPFRQCHPDGKIPGTASAPP
jgi:hypothetical protein